MQLLQHACATVPSGGSVQLTTRGVQGSPDIIAPGGALPTAGAASSWGLLRVGTSEHEARNRFDLDFFPITMLGASIVVGYHGQQR